MVSEEMSFHKIVERRMTADGRNESFGDGVGERRGEGRGRNGTSNYCIWEKGRASLEK